MAIYSIQDAIDAKSSERLASYLPFADTFLMRFLPQIVIVVLIWLVLLGTFISPELKTYSTQLISLLLLFYILVKHMDDRSQKKERKRARSDEDTLLFLTTYLKPKLTSLVDLTTHEENVEILRKQLELTESEVAKFLEDKEKETNTDL